jgi:hypothetical protein
MDECAILAGSHQNAILDSMTLAACSPKVPFTLSRGALFQGRLACWFLRAGSPPGCYGFPPRIS